MIFSRPDTGLADEFGIAVDIGRSAVAAELFGAELSASGSISDELLVAGTGRTSTFVNVLCESTLAVTCDCTAPFPGTTPTGSWMLWVQVPSQLKNFDGARREPFGFDARDRNLCGAKSFGNCLPLFAVAVTIQSGEVSERLNELASKASVGETQPGVRIPPSPPGILVRS